MSEQQQQQPVQGQQANPMTAVISLIIFGVGAWWYFGGGLQGATNQEMARIEKSVAADSEAQYNIAKSKGDKMDACVHAGLVAAAYLQAKDEASYERWKGVERSDCASAGLSRP